MDTSVLRYGTLPIARELEQLPLPRLRHKLQKSCKVGAGSQREIIDRDISRAHSRFLVSKKTKLVQVSV